MIVRPRPHWIHLLFVRRGSLIRLIWQQQLAIVLLSCAVVWVHGQLFVFKVTLNASPFSLMGVAMAIFLGFRINASYDRWWEARKHWGALLVESRNLARLVLSAAAPQVDARPFVLGLAGFAATARNQLRGRAAADGTQGLLPAELQQQLTGARSAPTLVLLWLGRWLQVQRAPLQIDGHRMQVMDGSLNALSMAVGSCERIANTPLPFTYSVILHRSAYVYCALLPFGLVDSIGWMTPLVVAFVSYTFFALEALSDQIEEPFGLADNDLALDAMAAGVEAGLREMLGDTPAPAPRPDAELVLH
ncbi:hypothetical protein GT347_20975 [Xylophilus rhododendri]|uniref:Bestrophin n=1 Tax=Xylophilus rhododendri TaxID=2697032 RepID=A0A857J8E4_9BURK|nr:bestrophin family ion channel [Xylophilus rhododendri]QHJ00235.1 hypothetical protein GT347_20975 [Xylophilus rhododendri]